VSALWYLCVAGLVLQSGEPTLDKLPVNLRCGSYALYVCLTGLGLTQDTFADLERKLGPPGAAGYSILQLEEVAKDYGANTLIVETSIDNLKSRREPFGCIVLLKRSHFVALYDIDGDRAYIIDPPREYSVPLDTFRALWEGKALLIAKGPLALHASRFPRQ
jgi:ABC-type bacteriocin/lantibiotic exporter with double-glycine peptidase domain